MSFGRKRTLSSFALSLSPSNSLSLLSLDLERESLSFRQKNPLSFSFSLFLPLSLFLRSLSLSLSLPFSRASGLKFLAEMLESSKLKSSKPSLSFSRSLFALSPSRPQQKQQPQPDHHHLLQSLTLSSSAKRSMPVTKPSLRSRRARRSASRSGPAFLACFFVGGRFDFGREKGESLFSFWRSSSAKGAASRVFRAALGRPRVLLRVFSARRWGEGERSAAAAAEEEEPRGRRGHRGSGGGGGGQSGLERWRR